MNSTFEFLRRFGGAPEKKSAPGGLLALALGSAACWGGRDTAALARNGVMQNAIAYACIRKIASAAASVPWLLYDGAIELESHPLLTQPNLQGTAPACSSAVTLSCNRRATPISKQ